MIDKNAEKFIAENRIQARRDLVSAKLLLSQSKPHLENVAFLLEQSFEKSLKASYATYKLTTSGESWKDVYNKVRGHDIPFMLKLLRDYYKDYGNFIKKHNNLADHVKSLGIFPKSMIQVIDSPEKQMDLIMKKMDQLEQRICNTTKNRNNFVVFLSGLNSRSIKEAVVEKTVIPEVLLAMNDFKNKSSGIADSSVLDVKKWLKYIDFVRMLAAIAPYALPHAIAGRYPIKECKMENLEAYRKYPELKGFFDTLASKITIMLDSEEEATNHLIRANI